MEGHLKNKERIYAVGGLIVGFLVGVVLIGSSDGLRTDLFGTAGSAGDSSDPSIEFDELSFYEVEFGDAKDWLDSVEPAVSQELEEDLNNVNGLGTTDDLGNYFTEIQDSIDTVLFTLHNTLLENADMEGIDRSQVSTCIALNRDPYSVSGPGVYVYVQVPEQAANTVPADWTSLSGPQEENMLYSTTCYSDANGESG
jgi:hypothetical protein